MVRMKRYVALLRGVNVGRAKRLAMADLRRILASLGYDGIRTLLNSGNAIFESPKGTPQAHAGHIQQALADELDLHALVVVQSAADFAAAVTANPLSRVAKEPSRFLVLFAQRDSTLSILQELVKENWAPEALAVGKSAAYLWCPGGILESPVLRAVNRKLGEQATARNWATVLKLKALLET